VSPPEHDAFTAALDGGQPTMWVPESSSAPFSSSTYFAGDGTYYAVETPVVSTVDRTGYGVRLEAGPDVDTSGRAVALDSLGDADRLALFALLGYPNDREMRKFEGARAISIGGTLAFPDDETEARSELAPDPTYDVIRIGGHDFRYRIVEARDAVIEIRRVEVEAVATSSDDFAALVYDRYGLDLDDRALSAEQRDIVAAAVDEGYDECAPYSDAYADLQTTLGGTGQSAPRDRRIDYANYENEWYTVQLSEYVA
jgi:hypothetical protein